MAEEMASRSPAAVDSAAAMPPAAISAMTQPGSCGDLGVGEHEDVLVEGDELVALVATLGREGLTGFGSFVVVLDAARRRSCPRRPEGP